MIFKYAGRHFEPLSIQLKGDFHSITRRTASVGIGNYPWSHTKYDYMEFYKAASHVDGGEADLFLCIEDGLVYIPCANELMLYKNGSAFISPHL